MGAAHPRQMAAFDQRLQYFLDEERVALGALLYRLRQRRDARLVAQMIAEQVADGLRGHRLQWQMLVIRTLHPARLVLRPEVHQQQIAARRDALDSGVQERVAAAVE